MEIKLKKYQSNILSKIAVDKTPEQYVQELVELHLDHLFIKDRDERIMEFAKSMIDSNDDVKNKVISLIENGTKIEDNPK